MFVVHPPCAPDVREPNTFRPARLEPDLEEGSAEDEQRRGHHASQTPPTVQGADLIARQIIHGNLRRTAALRQSEHLLLQATGHIVTIAGSSGRWNPRVDTPRHKQIFGDMVRQDVHINAVRKAGKARPESAGSRMTMRCGV